MQRDEIGEIFRRYGPLVYRRARAILGNHADAEEATQEVFVRALRGTDAFRHGSQVSTWLYRITTNYCLNLIRDGRRRGALLQEHGADISEALPGAPDPKVMALVRVLLAEAAEDCARAAVYVYIDGMTHQEAAEMLGVSTRTVGNLLARFQKHAAARIESITQAPAGELLAPNPSPRVKRSEADRG